MVIARRPLVIAADCTRGPNVSSDGARADHRPTATSPASSTWQTRTTCSRSWATRWRWRVLPGGQGSRWRRRLDPVGNGQLRGQRVRPVGHRASRRRRVPGRLRADAPAGRERLAARDRLPPPPSSVYRSWLSHRARPEGIFFTSRLGKPGFSASAPSSTPMTGPGGSVWRSASIGRSRRSPGSERVRGGVLLLGRPAISSPSPLSRPARSAARISWLARRGGPDDLAERRGGSAPVRRHVFAATATARPTASRRIPSSSRPARVPLRSMDRARNAPPKASPAPTVSATRPRAPRCRKRTVDLPRNGPRPVH